MNIELLTFDYRNAKNNYENETHIIFLISSDAEFITVYILYIH